VLREDRHRDDDTLSDNLFAGVDPDLPETLPEALDRKQWEGLKDRYYTLRGWDVETGRPTRTKLEALGMEEIAAGLEEAGKLG